MNLEQVKTALEALFNEQEAYFAERTIIFWYDDEGQFASDIDQLELDNAEIIRLDDYNAFKIKYTLETTNTGTSYLVYSPKPKPSPRENWLLDINKYSLEFSTDKAVLIMRDLGVSNPALVNIFRKHLKFFDNKERYRKFAGYKLENFTEESIEIAVMAALCQLPAADFEQVVRRVLSGTAERENRYLQAISSFGDLDAFWNLIEKQYGYHLEERNLEKLMLSFLITHLDYNLEEKTPSSWQPYITSKQTDTMLFVSSFINHSVDSSYYDKLANNAEETLKVKEYALQWDMDSYMACDTFKAFDEAIMEKLKKALLENIGEFDRYKNVIGNRRRSFWFKRFSKHYETIYYATELLNMEQEMGKQVKSGPANDIFKRYTDYYYLMDYYYRKFYLHFDQIEDKEPFTDLVDKIENTYKNWYLDELSIKWSDAVEDELATGYPLAGVSQQANFYNDNISKHTRSGDRVFVIISDALRYEVGRELLELINGEIRGSATLSSMQGVVPSTTQMGMTALLPSKTIQIDNDGNISADGISTQGTQNRARILEAYSENAVAIQAGNLLDMKRAEYKELVEGSKLIYIYHNTIDAIGDDSQTEKEVFEAVEKALQQILQLVKSLVNNISATNIYITADHGFVYRRSPLEEHVKLSSAINGALNEGRRHALVDTAETPEGCLAVSMDYLLGKESNLKAIMPKSIIRFKLPGAGANFTHGGVSLQEIALPLITFKYLRKERYKASRVTVKLTSISRKITNRITYLDFLQTDRVEEKKLPLKLKLYFTDEAGNRISNENIIIADSSAAEAQDRKHREKFTLKEMAYDKSKKYYLVMEDEEQTVEKVYEKIPFAIDLLISDDFTF